MNGKVGIRALPVLLTLLLVCTAITPVVAEDVPALRPQPVESLEKGVPPNIELMQVADNIKDSTPYWILLAAGEPERQIILEWVSELNVPEDEEDRMSMFLQEIWRKYPVMIEKEGNTIHMSFTPGAQYTKLTENENRMLEEISTAITKVQFDLYNTEISPEWHGGQHSDIIYLSVKKWGYSDALANEASVAADDPDTWPSIVPPSGYEEFDDFINTVCHSWDHYYNPTLGTGWAPLRCGEFSGSAKDKIDQYDWEGGMRDLGWSSHFMTDVGNPLHTGNEVEQAAFPWVHFAYEDYVGNNWMAGYQFKNVVANNWEYHAVYSPDLTTRLLAGFSKNYEDTVYSTIFFYPDSFDSNQNLRAATEACLLSTAKDTLGLVKYVTD
jgi:hypothetical protein